MNTAKYSISWQKTNKIVFFRNKSGHNLPRKWQMEKQMSYRFRNKGETSNAQLVYDWIAKNKPGFKFTYQEPATAIDLPRAKWPNVSAALVTFQKAGAIKVSGKKVLTGPKGRKFPTTVFEFVKPIDRRKHAKPIEHTKNRTKKAAKPQIDPTKKRIKKLTSDLLNLSVKIESLMLELYKAAK